MVLGCALSAVVVAQIPMPYASYIERSNTTFFKCWLRYSCLQVGHDDFNIVVLNIKYNTYMQERKNISVVLLNWAVITTVIIILIIVKPEFKLYALC